MAMALAGLLTFGVMGSASLDGYTVEGDPVPQVLQHPQIHLRPLARLDVQEHRVDPRLLAMLLVIAQEHTLADAGPFIRGHSYYVSGSRRVSLHSFGRGVDIVMIDGEPVSTRNQGALAVAVLAGNLSPPLRPAEIGSPWDLSFPGISTFSRNHSDHLHLSIGEA